METQNTNSKRKLPDGVGICRDSGGKKRDGSRKILWRVRLGPRFLGPGRSPVKKAFGNETEAWSWIEEQTGQATEAEAAKFEITKAAVHEMHVAMMILAGRASLVDAANAWEKYVGKAQKSVSVLEAIEALHADQKAQGLSDLHCRETRAKLKRFFSGLYDVKICDVTQDDVENARDAAKPPRAAAEGATPVPPSPEQKVKRLRYASILLEFAIGKRWLKADQNPLLGVSRPKIERKRIEALSVGEVAKLLIACQETNEELLPGLAMKVFTGLRNEELFHLTWDAFRSKTLRIEKTKTDRARSTSILDVLRAWIPHPKKSGLIFSIRPEVKDREAVWLEEIKEVEEKAGVNIPQNGLRHTFGGFHYCLKKDAAATAYEMGNSPKMVKDHYADAVDDDDCRRFWNLIPAIAESMCEESKSTFDTDKEEPEPESKETNTR